MPSWPPSWGDEPDHRYEAVILPEKRDPRFVTIRRGGSLSDANHRLLAEWAADCAAHVLHFFESEQPADRRPREAIAAIRSWAGGQMKMMECRSAGTRAMRAAQPLSGASRHAAYAAGHAAAVAHVAAHELGAAAYAIKAVWADAVAESVAGAPAGVPAGTLTDDQVAAGRAECRWQREQLPDAIRSLVLDDQRLRNEICWSAFDV